MLGQEPPHLPAPQFPPQPRPFGGIDPVQLKKMFRRIHSNSDNLVHGRLPCLRFATTSFWHTRCRRGPSTPSRRDGYDARRGSCLILPEPRRPVVMGPCFRRDDTKLVANSLPPAATIA